MREKERLKKTGETERRGDPEQAKKKEIRRATENGGKYWRKTNNKKLRGRQGQVEAEGREERVPS